METWRSFSGDQCLPQSVPRNPSQWGTVDYLGVCLLSYCLGVAEKTLAERGVSSGPSRPQVVSFSDHFEAHSFDWQECWEPSQEKEKNHRTAGPCWVQWQPRGCSKRPMP